MPKQKVGFYAVAVGKKSGVYKTWDETEKQVKGFPGSKHKKFATEEEAQEFVKEYCQVTSTQSVGEADLDTDDVNDLGQQFQSMTFKSERKEVDADDAWIDDLRLQHGNDLVAFCAGSAPLNGREGCTAAYAVSFPLEGILTVRVTDNPTNIRADCLAALEATKIANRRDPSMKRNKRIIVIYSRYQGLVFAMAKHDGKPRWIDNWQRNNRWKTPKNKPVAHSDIYKKMLQAEKLRTISWVFLDQETRPELLLKLHGITHDEAERLARDQKQVTKANESKS